MRNIEQLAVATIMSRVSASKRNQKERSATSETPLMF
jgi:hypothetical protein